MGDQPVGAGPSARHPGTASSNGPFVRRLLLALGTIAVALAFLAGPAFAHAFLVDSSPRPGERLASSPDAVRLLFTEPVVAGSARIEVHTPDGEPVDIGPPRVLGPGQEVEALLPTLEEGPYVVAWEARSALDGHIELGEFAFAVGIRGRLSTFQVTTGGGTAWPEAAASWVALLGIMLAAGALVSERWVWEPVAARHGVTIPGLPIGLFLGVALIGSLAQLLLLVWAVNGGGGSWGATVTTPAGLVTVIQLLAVAQAMPLRLRWGREGGLALLGLALAAVALRSHAASVGSWWAVPANALHLMAGALWVGGLVHLVLVARRLRGGSGHIALVEGAKRYAALALTSVALVMATGVVVALGQFRETSQLLTTGYGRVLLVKLTLVVATLSLAVAARRRALGRSGGDANLLRRLTRPEAALLLLVIPVATVLANTTPPWAQASRFVLGAPPLRGSVVRLAGLAGSPLAVHVAAVAGRLEVRVVDTIGEPAGNVRVEIEGRAPAGTELAVSPRSCGRGCVTTAFRWQEGSTELAVTVVSGEWGRGTARFSVPWPPGPRGSRLLDRVVRAMREQPEIEMTERVSSGLGAVSEYAATLTGRRFVAQELYAAGGATDVREIPSSRRTRMIVAYLPGSWIWYRLEIDDAERLLRETVVSPGHLIERTFRYPGQP